MLHMKISSYHRPSAVPKHVNKKYNGHKHLYQSDPFKIRSSEIETYENILKTRFGWILNVMRVRCMEVTRQIKTVKSDSG